MKTVYKTNYFDSWKFLHGEIPNHPPKQKQSYSNEQRIEVI